MIKKNILSLLIIFAFSNASFSQKKKIVRASYYAHYFQGRTTANGEKFDMYKMTCAHKTLPFNTILRVRNLRNNKVVYVRVNDRGPYVKGRSIDLSYQAAKELGYIKYGVTRIEYQIVKSKKEYEEQNKKLAKKDDNTSIEDEQNIEETDSIEDTENYRIYIDREKLHKISSKIDNIFIKKTNTDEFDTIKIEDRIKLNYNSFSKKKKEKWIDKLLNKLKLLF